MNKSSIIIATRKSQLALWQAEYVKQLLLQHYPQLDIVFLTKTTTGDERQDVSLSAIGGKNLFVKELQAAVLAKEADIAVHSIKDLSCTPHPELLLAAMCERADPRDAFLSHRYPSLQLLPPKSIIGTSSPRRECQLKFLRPDLTYTLLRGNVDTRIKKLKLGEYDAIILAAAGLTRLNLLDDVTEYFSPTEMLPAIGQGAIGIECRSDDTLMQEFLEPLNHLPTYYCVSAERAVNRYLGGDCFTPIAAHANLVNDQLTLMALVGSLTTQEIISTKIQGPSHSAEALGAEAAKNLLNKGAAQLLT